MPLPDEPSTRGPAGVLLLQEIRGLLVSPALWGMFIILSFLVGYSFFQAVDLFTQASRTAAVYPELAAGMNPLDGIFVPTFGAYYLCQTLLLPFVAIRLIGLDKQSGALKLLLQLPLSPSALCGLKLSAMILVYTAALLPAVSALILWHMMGGYISFPETAALLAGHGLYFLMVVTIAMFAGAVSDSLPTAAMLCLAVTLGSWVLDFAAVGQSGFPGALGSFSPTNMLRQFENGLPAVTTVTIFLCIALFFFLLTIIWLHPGRSPRIKLSWSCIALATVFCLGLSSFLFPGYLDVTENQRHSFNPADSRALHTLNKPLTLTIHLDPQDSRLTDLKRNVLARLRRNVPELKLIYPKSTSTAALFAAADDDRYGLIEYSYNGRRDQSYSNSEQEILGIIYSLAGLKVIPDPVPVYNGHPLEAQVSTGSKWWFYCILPALFLCGGLYGRKGKW